MAKTDKTAPAFEDDPDTCPKAKDGKHQPDWSTAAVTHDGEYYLDVNCKLCGRSGCIGSVETLTKDISW